MLAFTRGIGETIRINDDISIQVLSVCGQQVKLSIRAPIGTTIHREEIFRLIKAKREKLRLNLIGLSHLSPVVNKKKDSTMKA